MPSNRPSRETTTDSAFAGQASGGPKDGTIVSVALTSAASPDARLRNGASPRGAEPEAVDYARRRTISRLRPTNVIGTLTTFRDTGDVGSVLPTNTALVGLRGLRGRVVPGSYPDSAPRNDRVSSRTQRPTWSRRTRSGLFRMLENGSAVVFSHWTPGRQLRCRRPAPPRPP
jgi:hypothetical protein